jgi:photosystem II stability/assembly factor-like uncharacterized protein
VTGKPLPAAGQVVQLQAAPAAVPAVKASKAGSAPRKFPGWIVLGGLVLAGGLGLLLVAALIAVFFFRNGGVSLPAGKGAALPYTWTSSGPEGGNILSVAVDPAAPSTIYVGTNGLGVFKSTDRGESWQGSSAGLFYDSDLIIRALTIDPGTPATIYASTSGGLFKSIDAGGRWTKLTSGVPEYFQASCLAIDPAAPATLYAGTVSDGVFKSTDGGASWSAVNSGLSGYNTLSIQTLLIDPSAHSTIYAGTFEGLYESTDGGESWRLVSLDEANWTIYALAIDPVAPAILYAGTSQGLYKSKDKGASWTRIETGLHDSSVSGLALDPAAPNSLYALVSYPRTSYSSSDPGSRGSPGVFKTTDAGATWSEIDTGLEPEDVSCLAIDPASPATVYLGTHHGMFKSSDAGASWNPIDAGLSAVAVTSLAIDPDVPEILYAAAGDGGVFKSTDGGASWSALNSGLAAGFVTAVVIDPSTPTTVYAVEGYGELQGGVFGIDQGVFKSTDGGESWNSANAGLSLQSITALVIDPSAPDTLYVGTLDGGVFKSTDGARSWRAAGEGLPEETVTALVIDPSSPQILYAGMFQGGIFKSVDGGESWESSSTGLPLSDTSLHSLGIDPSAPATLVVGLFPGKIYLSTDGAESWSALDAGLPYSDASRLAFIPGQPGSLFAAATNNYAFHFSEDDSLGVFKTIDGGKSWTEIETPLTGLYVFCLAVDPGAPATLYLGTTRGVFKGSP